MQHSIRTHMQIDTIYNVHVEQRKNALAHYKLDISWTCAQFHKMHSKSLSFASMSVCFNEPARPANGFFAVLQHHVIIVLKIHLHVVERID